MTVYQTIVADPPWPFQWDCRAGGRRRRSTELGYETMSYDAIATMLDGSALKDALSPDSTLMLWVTQAALHSGEAQDVAIAWGFPHRVGEVIWHKRNFGTGVYPRIGHETCLIYKAGDGSLRAGVRRDVHSVQTWKQTHGRGNGGKTHSAKPEAFYDFVEAGFVGPYLELFARRARFGWDYWGDQSLGTAEVAA